MFKINSEKELLNLLKIVAEEAVIKSKKMLNESTDIAQERYINSLNSSENLYNVKLSEQEEPEEEPASDDIESEEEEPEEVQEKEVLDPEDFGVSFDSVIKDINTLRSGRSTKDKEIKGELLGYYEKLDEGERKILHLFLRELSKILQGALDANDAIDPSGPPFNAEITFGNKESESEKASSRESEKSDTSASTASTNDERTEDSRPPIKVNESQNLNEIRKKISRLMKRY